MMYGSSYSSYQQRCTNFIECIVYSDTIKHKPFLQLQYFTQTLGIQRIKQLIWWFPGFETKNASCAWDSKLTRPRGLHRGPIRWYWPKQYEGQRKTSTCAGINAKLKANPYRPALPSSLMEYSLSGKQNSLFVTELNQSMQAKRLLCFQTHKQLRWWCTCCSVCDFLSHREHEKNQRRL